MIPDGNPLIHVKQSKNMCCVVSKKLDLKKRDFFIQNTFFNINFHKRIYKKTSFGMFQLKRPFEYKDNIKVLTRKVTNEK